MLDVYIPGVEKMATALNNYRAAFDKVGSLQNENADLKQKVKAKEAKSIDEQLQYAKLKQDYATAMDLIQRLPKEILETYKNSNKQRAIQQDSR